MRISDWSSDVCSSDLWVSHLRGAPARPRQAIGFAVARTAMRAQSGPVEGVLVGHVEPQALRRLAGVADRPAPVIEFAGDVIDERIGAVTLDVLEHLVGETSLIGEKITHIVVRI